MKDGSIFRLSVKPWMFNVVSYKCGQPGLLDGRFIPCLHP